MKAFFGILALIGCCGIPLCAVNLLIRKVREKPTKKTKITLVLMIIFLVAGVIVINFG